MMRHRPLAVREIHGSTDTEVVFYLALTFGLEEDPISALERTVGLIEATAARLGVEDPVQGSFGISDGTRLWAVRYATDGRRARCSPRRTWTRSAACIPTTRAPSA